MEGQELKERLSYVQEEFDSTIEVGDNRPPFVIKKKGYTPPSTEKSSPVLMITDTEVDPVHHLYSDPIGEDSDHDTVD